MSNSASAIVAPWLVIIGIGEDGVAGLGDEAKRLIATAPVAFGGARHIELVGSLITGECQAWQSPFEKSVDAIVARRGSPVVVLASGDPFLFGAGATLARRIDAAEMRVIPAPSSFSLAASRLGWALQDVATVSLHGRPLDLIRPHLHPGARVLALTSDEVGPKALAALLCDSGFGRSQLTVLEALGGARERISRQIASSFALEDLDPLNVCAIEVVADAEARVLPLAAGLDDALFEHDGQITKREVRALTLSALAPRKGELLWDVGAGSGSIAIEWMLADPAMRAIAIEASPERAARIGRNAARFGVPGLAVIEGEAPGALRGLAPPDVIFIGGGGSEPGVMDAAIAALRPGGRLVANAVTTEMEAVLIAQHAQLGGSLIRIDIARASPLGTMTGWRPAMPVTQWSWVKP
ncbi:MULTISPECIES: precorrin-6y C5,15-methyltransferase (decarboxylating) subunit CbiE [unclassified Sinorhizobium]|uniref:precorrin-6y C5,15-methyltransferase (decarboxylating) subunit CbiE n=1 Tax=unclassified Sinorhizobium TaxID=2613772 RepID=UPI0024C28437|nr:MULTISPECIES: precorrin-6y C5,15-methyltransferase (decarboxylating) subunit CbiE [unclassified Sinorhizobium]MDK1375402.1 precorrin-6y C5,15-methyltransferase (decarboxylating) subunit CbiE [Sinorhizobium sp. 6-70]MDK1477930.1 precorrin-6y C5,15-methyltransferase (decarboxylating) subunit CbiE [Sinorhizobium sp. 6-117]